jgi:tetratricopeptide (TPR) repeat protein
VTAALVDAQTDANVWSETFDRTLDDVFAIQSGIAERIAQSLAASLTQSERRSIDRRPTESREAWDLYLRAEAARVSDSTSDLPVAERLFRKAIEVDPTFALAIAQLSRVVNNEWWFVIIPERAKFEEALALANRALALQPDLPEAHLALGMYLYHGHYDYAGGEAEFRLALKSAPNCAECFEYIGYLQRRQDRWDDALGSFVRSLELDPRNEVTLRVHAIVLQQMRRYREAAAAADRQARISSHPERAAIQRGWIELEMNGDERSLREALAKTPADDDVLFDRWHLAMIHRRFDDALGALGSMSGERLNAGYGTISKEELRGLTLTAAGKKAQAHAALVEARAAYEKLLHVRPDDALTLILLARTNALLGNPEAARREAAQASALLPEAKDAVDGLRVSIRRVQVLIVLGELDAALAETERLATVNAGFEWTDLEMPIFDPLRPHPRFQQVLARLRGH